MTRHLLDNTTWDFPTSCFVCEPRNSRGLGVRFYHDDEAARVVAEFVPEAHHTGAPTVLHGGVSMALLDEGMAWAAIAIARRFAYTERMETRFLRPLRVGQAVSVSCWIASQEGETLRAVGELRNERGKLCVAANGDYHALTAREARSAIGTESDQIAEFIQGGEAGE